MYSYDQEYGGASDGAKQCEHVENPMKPYKWMPPEPLVCDEDELGIIELENCQIQVKEQNGEIEKVESVYLQCLIKNTGDIDKCAPRYKQNFNDFVYINMNPDAAISIVWITNPSCDEINYFWNDNDGN